jgi:hypothetical protein
VWILSKTFHLSYKKKITDRFSKLYNWEQLLILSAFEIVASLMTGEEIEASPINTLKN